MRAGPIIAVAIATLAAAPARAQSPGNQIDVAGQLEAAQDALAAQDHARAADLAGAVLSQQVARADLTEAWRLRALALFFLGRGAEAEGAMLEFLKLNVNATLDPALVPPEGIKFFEEVRNRHAAELRAYRPTPPRRLHWWWNLVPVAGQIQNGDTTKAWVVGGAEVALLAINLSTYSVLQIWCSDADRSCETEGSDRNDTARALKVVNTAAGIALIGVAAYGVVDAFVGYRGLVRDRERESAEPPPVSLGVLPTHDGVVLSIGGRF